MAKKTSQIAQVGKRKIEISNLNKVFFPEDGIIKAELIHYYYTIAPTILKHIKNRPLSLIRFPDGIYGETFFQKNKPDWAPNWIEHITLGDKPKNYVLPSEEAIMVWLANLACIEIHQIHAHKPHFDKPDYFVFDIDPPENYGFEKVIDIAYRIKSFIDAYDYHCFVKTTGGKGVHIVIPIEAKWDFHTVFENFKPLAQQFVDANKDTTLHIKKESRKGRVLIDIYRNRRSQTIVSAYSVRGRAGAPVSMPVTWEQLKHVKDPNEFNINNVFDHLKTHGDAWEALRAYAVDIHTDRHTLNEKKELEKSRTYKSPEQLDSYNLKRNFNKTSEPIPQIKIGDDNRFVVHRHHASRLHYDLRLEKDGALRSWAVPRGLPPRPGIKRMAIEVEDHPTEYLSFEAEIPKGQYGGGMMWIYASGKYDVIKEKKDGFYFKLNSKEITAEYRIYNTKNNEWLLERLDQPQIDWPIETIDFMLSESRNEPLTNPDYQYEVKWDGIRAMIYIDEGQMRIMSRNGMDLSNQFPELMISEQAFRVSSAIFDTEIVCLDKAGHPNFKKVIGRMHQRHEASIQRAMKTDPVICYVFDCLYLDGRSIMHDPLERRRDWMADAIKKDTAFRVSQVVEDGYDLFDAAKKLGLEGIMAKDLASKYLVGKRSHSWYKIKVRNTVDCIVIGYTKGNGDRKPYFGALHIAEIENDELIYRGKVGTGFTLKRMKEIHLILKDIEIIKRPIKEKPIDDSVSVWITPKIYIELQYASITKNNTYREPVFLRIRLDKN